MQKQYSDSQVRELTERVLKVRRLIVDMIARAGSGHPGGSLSATELVTCLYFGVLRHRPSDPHWPERDRFHMSKGHCCPLWYAVLAEGGYFPPAQLQGLRRLGSNLQGHPDRRTAGIDVASGSLGQGLGVALGMSLAARIDKLSYRVYCLLGDGESQEGSVWEAAMAAAHFGCSNLCAILDYNGFQIDGRVCDIMGLEPLKEKWKAFGWHVIEIDGHSIPQVLGAFEEASQVKDQPQIIIAHTIKGKGVSFMENVVDFHGRAPTLEEREKALRELGHTF